MAAQVVSESVFKLFRNRCSSRSGIRTLIVLTAGELGRDWPPPDCWRTGAAGAIASQLPPLMSLRALADATQQIHLELPPGDGWPHNERQIAMPRPIEEPV
jgi:hypothetical protein